jgi:hypothetical protein
MLTPLETRVPNVIAVFKGSVPAEQLADMSNPCARASPAWHSRT